MFISSGYSAHTRRASGTEHHHRAADMIGGRRYLDPSGPLEADLHGLALELVRSQRVDPNHVSLHRPPTVGVHSLPAPLEHEPPGTLAHGGGLARVQHSVELADV